VGRPHSRQGDRSGGRGSVVRGPGDEDEVPDHDRADRGDGAVASGWRDRHASRRDSGVEHADDRQPQHEHVDRTDCRGRNGTALVAVLSVAEPRGQPRHSRRRGRGGLHRDRRHGRSAGVVTTSGRCRIGTLAGEAPAQVPAVEAAVEEDGARQRRQPDPYPGLPVIACSPDGSGTRGAISTTFARS
jgi:hypothetical protein